MAHLEQYSFVVRMLRMFTPMFHDKRVLGIGTRDINSSSTGYDVEALFQKCDHVKLDLAPGAGVTHVCHAADFEKDASQGFDVVYSCEALEYDKRWRETCAAMVRLCRPGGLVFITTAGPGREEHGTTRANPEVSPATTDYYGTRTIHDLLEALGAAGNFRWYAVEDFRQVHDVYFWGVRR